MIGLLFTFFSGKTYMKSESHIYFHAVDISLLGLAVMN